MSDPGSKPPPDEGTSTEAMGENLQPVIPRWIGTYHVLSLLGEGGFGAVYLAEQTEPVRRRVALKVIKPGMGSAAVLARFEAERQALAVMDHPGVARVYDAGSTEKGQPYFVMEYVRGVPITEHCDRQRLGLKQRIALFIQVCEAVQHAHMKGVIHRDLKPGNILVEYQESSDGLRVMPKVIDFGVAKSLDRPLTDKTLHTEIGQLIGTPEYMSPEQAGTSGQDVDTRADIYSLGVVLYELLAGSSPFLSGTLRNAGFGEVLRLIREVEPPRPSTRLSASGTRQGLMRRKTQVRSDAVQARLAHIARQRRTDARSLHRALKADLDWIVMKCLEKDRARRYETANALAMDLGRHLRHEPVLAGPPRIAYRLGKFIRRNRVPVAAVSAVLASLAVGLVGVAMSLAEANRQRELAEAARAETAQKAAELEQVVEFQASMLGDLDPERVGRSLLGEMNRQLRGALESEELPATESIVMAGEFDAAVRYLNPTDIARWLLDEMILASAVDAIDRGFQNQPLVAAALRQTVGDVYRGLGMLSPARAQLDAALAIRTEQLGPSHPTTLASRRALGELMLNTDQLDQALGHLMAAAEGFRRHGGQTDPQANAAAISLAMVLRRLDRLDEALAYTRHALEGSLERGGLDDSLALTATNYLGVLYEAMGDWQQAETHFIRALEGRRRVLGEFVGDTLVSYQNVGLNLWRQYRLEEASPYLEKAVRLARRIHGEDHPVTLQTATSLGALLQSQGRLDEAERLLARTHELYQRTLGEQHYETLKSLANLAAVQHKQGRLAEAERTYRQALAGFQATVGADDRLTLIQLGNLGGLLADQGRFEEAEGYLKEAVDRGLRAHGAVDDVVVWINNLASIMRDQGEYDEALGLADLAITKARESLPEAYLGRFLMTRARILGGLGRWAEAAETMEEAHQIISGAMGVGNEWAREAATNLVEYYRQWSMIDPAGGHERNALRWRAVLDGRRADAEE